MLALPLGLNAQQLPAPKLTCVSALPLGGADITWEQVTDPDGVFLRYDVYDENGTLLTGIPFINTTNHVHAGAGTDMASQGFYVVAVASNGTQTSDPSDTVYSIFLNVVNPGNGEAWLNWNAMHDPNISGASRYRIFKEYPLGTWTLIDSTEYGDESYIDTITVCNEQINYKIVVDNQTCFSESNVDGGIFEDKIAPATPTINSVSVDTANGNIVIDWNKSKSPDTDGYIVMAFLPGPGWTAIDTVYGINNTNISTGLFGPGSAFHQFAIIAFDSCISATGFPNTSPLSVSHRTIYAQFEQLPCDYGVRVFWTPYINWSDGLNNYEVFFSENNGPYISMGTTIDTTLDVTGLNGGSDYCFFVKANSNDGKSSFSNILCYNIYEPVLPTFGYLATATVVGDDVELRYLGDVGASVQAVKLERSLSIAGPFDPVGIAPISGPITTFTDQTADPSSRSYYYRAVAIDSCGNESIVSNIARTIYLEVGSDSYTLENDLVWNLYEDWDGNVQEYRIYRSINGLFDLTPIATILPGGLVYLDNVSDQLKTNGEVCYYIEGVEMPNSYGLDETSHSNVVCVYMESMMWIPNAIVIGGANPEFKPVWSFIDIDNYRMEIRDRWGQIAFETNDPFQGWDGSNAGIVDSEVFVYTVSFKTSGGTDVVRRGRVTVIR